jgi:radical SAM superfamily enzyme
MKRFLIRIGFIKTYKKNYKNTFTNLFVLGETYSTTICVHSYVDIKLGTTFIQKFVTQK